MKKILFLLLVPVLVLAQSQNQNYVKTTTYKGVGATLPVAQVTYFDGLGRPIQQIANAQSHTGKDIVTHIEYDAFGRQVKDYLPYANTTPSLNYNSSAGSETGAFYNTPQYESTTNPYSEKLLENSPLNRVLKQAAPGNAWLLGSGHEIKLDYQTNTATEVKYFKATATWNTGLGLYDITITNPSNYPANTLYKMVTKNENWTTGDNNTTQEFKNKNGQVVLKRTFDNGAHDTYYVYDQYGNLTYVLPPLAEGTTTNLDGLCYQYKHDYRNRQVAKKIPGKQWEYVLYDKLDRPVAMGPVFSPWGDGTMGILVSQYDIFSRVTQTGYKIIVLNETTRNSLQNDLNTGTNPFVLATNDILTKNYYDNYTYPNAPTLPTTLPNSTYPIAQNAKGLPTGSWVRVLTLPSETNGESSYIFYDDKYRSVRTHTTNYLGGFTQVDSNLDFIGKTNYTVTTHKRVDADEAITIKDSFTYSTQDRLLLHKQQINSLPEELIASNTYNELGQLTSKNVGGADATGALGLQKVDYNYNIRGWLKGINDTANLNQGTTVPEDLFAFKLSYNDPTTATALYNGNISETFWKTKNDNVLRKYGYTYDNLNRLLSATYQKPESTVVNTNSYNESLNYDKNGNITHLTRTGEYDDAVYQLTIDDLAYNYAPNSNQLLKVFDSTNNPKGFQDDTYGISDPDDDYAYDANGNMTSDTNKSITSITYNHLNLPTKIVISDDDNKKIEYIYNAIGQKLNKNVRQMVHIGLGIIQLRVTTTDYLDGFQYVDNALDYFLHPEGYVKVFGDSSQGFEFYYTYNYTDHLGNVRLSYGLDPGTTTLKIFEENNYYPFGLKHNNYNTSRKRYIMNGLATTVGTCNGCYEGYKMKFSNKELQDELGLNVYDFGARNYDPALGRWMNIDVKSETSRRFSPYVYALNNPVYFIDPDGMEGEGFDGGGGMSIEEFSTNRAGGEGSNLGGMGSSPPDWYENKNTGNVKWVPGSAKIAGFRNLGTSTNLVAGTGQGLQLNADGTATDMNSGKEYGNNKTIVVNSSTGTTVSTAKGSEALDKVGKVNDVVDAVSKSANVSLNANAPASIIGGNITKVTGPVGYVVNAGQVGVGVYNDGGTFGSNAKVATGNAVGSMMGAEAGGVVGAELIGGIGTLICPGPGTVIGGVIGGIGGAIWGGITGCQVGTGIATDLIKK